MGKMHELLAVESSIAGNYGRDHSETLHVMSQAVKFRGEISEKRHFAEENKHLNVREETKAATTVPDRLQWHSGFLSKFLDVQIQKDKTNQVAKADIEIDGKVLYKDVPSTTLLMLETKLGGEFRKVLDAVPTLDSGSKWEFDDAQSLWMTNPPKTFVTKKVTVPVVLYPATDKHPAQVKEAAEDRPVAETIRTVYSGMITSAQKAVLLERLDILVAAIKRARQRANATEVVPAPKFGEVLTDFILKDLKLGA
jgi:hypothetical protein